MTNEEKNLVKRAEYFYHIDQLRKTYTKRGRFENGFVRSDSFESEDSIAAYSDGGKGAAVIRDFGRLPEFVYLVRYEVSKLRGPESKTARALMREESCEAAREKIKYSTRRFYAILKKLKPRFTQCLQAYHDYQASRR